MSKDSIQTKHPHGKSGRSIDRQKYDQMKTAMLSVLKDGELTHNELMSTLEDKLHGKFTGNIGWYAETLKLDLEARNIIERTNSKPQKYRIR